MTLMKTTGCADARDIREKLPLQNILTEVNSNIGVLSVRRLGMVSTARLDGQYLRHQSACGTDDPLRASSPPLGLLRITYIYRDPRDAMLSAYEFGQRAISKGRPNAFSHLCRFRQPAWAL
jgi:hypothetical protein